MMISDGLSGCRIWKVSVPSLSIHEIWYVMFFTIWRIADLWFATAFVREDRLKGFHLCMLVVESCAVCNKNCTGSVCVG